MEQFKQRKLKGFSKDSNGTDSEEVVQKGVENNNENDSTMVVASLKELGVSEELVEVMEGIGEFAPSEIQCVVIPSVLEGKSVLLSAPSEPDTTLAFLLPLIQVSFTFVPFTFKVLAFEP